MHAPILRYFVAVANAGSIRKASEELHVASSALSRQIQKLEYQLGTPLFERYPDGLRLTQAGTVTLRHAKSTLERYDLLKSEIGALTGSYSGVVRVACLDSLLVRFLPEQIVEFSKANPDVDFRVQSGAHGRVAGSVANGEADFGITFNLSSPADTQLVYDVPMPLMAMVSAEHPLAARKEVTLDECAEYKLLLHLDNEVIRSLIEVELSVFERSGRAFVRSNNISLLRKLVQLGAGVAFYTPVGMADEIIAGSIVSVPVTGTKLAELRLGILLPRRRRLIHAADAMVQQLSGALEEMHNRLKDRIWDKQT